MRLSSEQKVALASLDSAHINLLNAKVVLRKEIEESYKVALTRLEVERSIAANRCLSLKVPKTQIRVQLRTSSWDTMMSVLNLSAESFQTEQELAAEMVDAEPVEILEREESEPGRGGPWIRFKAKESGVVGDMWANRSGNWDFVWREVSPSRHEVQVWYSEKFGVGKV